jgi:glutamine cyclotransferase
VPYNIVGSTYVQSFSVSAQDGSPQGLAFNTDGTKMFFIGLGNDNVYEYNLSTGFDISTSVYSQAFSVASQDTFPRGLAFNSDGTKMFVTGDISDSVFEYTLSTGFDISTASYSQSFSVSAQDTTTQGIAFNTTGTRMYIVGQDSDAVYEYTLSTGFDISSASYSQSFSIASQDNYPNAIAFNTDGTKMFITGNADDDINEYTLATGFDVSTASFVDIFSVSPQDGQPQGIAFNTTGTRMFFIGSLNDNVYEYSTGGGSVTTVPAGRALSTSSILLEG